MGKIQRKKKLWSALAVVFMILTAVLSTLTDIANTYASVINKTLGISTSTEDMSGADGDTYYYPSAYENLQDLYQDKTALIRTIAQEGTVLLKNEEETLPLSQGGKVVILGEDAFRYDTTNAGGTMKIDYELAESLTEALQYDGMNVVEDIGELTTTDTVIVVIGRAGGETKDLDVGSLALTEEEKQQIETAKQSGAKVVLLLSGDYSLEIEDYKKDAAIGAIVKFGNAGFCGTYGLADVLTGKESPSGKLVDTMAVNSLSAPAMMNFGSFQYTGTIKASLAQSYLVYAEGIYTDYKYYETRYEDCVLKQGNAASEAGVYAGDGNWEYEKEVSYPFGYGLSYTSFEKEIAGEPDYDKETDTWTVKVKVTNTGKTDGKEVVQIYAQTPYTDYDRENQVEKPAVMLMGYAKTEKLAPGEEQTVEIAVHQQWLASYDYVNAKGYIMDAGNYYLIVGENAHDAVNNVLKAKGVESVPGNENLVKEISPAIKTDGSLPDTEMYRTVYSDTPVTNAFDDADLNTWMNDKVVYLSRNDWNETYPVTVTELTPTDAMKESLQDKKKYESGTVDTRERAKTEETLQDGQAEEDDIKIIDLKGKAYDDPDWQRLLDKLTTEEISNVISDARYTIPSVSSIAFREANGNDNPTGLWEKYKYSSIDRTTGEKTPVSEDLVLRDGISGKETPAGKLLASMYCSEPVLAATFNNELAAEQGAMFGEDALYCGMNFIWGMGANMHRTPYGGRASEYFSSDAVQSALMGAAWNKAANEKGCVMVVKHLVANEQEANRNGVSTFLNEQTLRENYLRPFEGITVYGGMRAVMTSYNRIGLVCTAAEYDLMTQVLRKEWGFEGYAITDLYSPTAGCYDGNAMVVAGTDAMLSNASFATGTDYVTQTLSPENIEKDEVLKTSAREACHRIFYVFANSNLMNGVSAETQVATKEPFYMAVLRAGVVVCMILSLLMIVLTILAIVADPREKIQYRMRAVEMILLAGAAASFLKLSQGASETGEKPELVLALTGIAFVLTGIGMLWDRAGIFGMAAIGCAAAALMNFIAGRVSYLAFYFSGDINQTGLSVWFVLALLFYILALIVAVILFFKENKAESLKNKEGDKK